jgi:hypothetical protein
MLDEDDSPTKIRTTTNRPQITQHLTCLGERYFDGLGMSKISDVVKEHSERRGK